MDKDMLVTVIPVNGFENQVKIMIHTYEEVKLLNALAENGIIESWKKLEEDFVDTADDFWYYV